MSNGLTADQAKLEAEAVLDSLHLPRDRTLGQSSKFCRLGEAPVLND
jgi:hypothetical protein